MIIKKLILKGYKRLFLNNIDLIEYTPKESIQIILGRNGSGKSSLIRHLNPIPADLKKDFTIDGYKYVEIEHRNNNYVVSSGYHHKGKHSFIVNTIELNPGGTKRVQLELVKEHFNLTQAIVDIIIGSTTLTTMSTPVRKYWFSELSTIDYTFSISVFNKLKQRHRDVVGGIKLLQEDLIKLETMVVDDVTLNKLKEDKKILEQFINYVLGLYNHNVSNISDTDIIEDLSSVNYELNRLYKNKENTDLNIDSVRENYNVLKTKREHVDIQISKLNKDIESIETKLVASSDKERLLKEQTEILKDMKLLKSDNYLEIDINNITVIKNSLEYDYTDIVSMLNELSEYNDILLSKELLLKTQKRHDVLSTSLKSLRYRLEITVEDLKQVQTKKSEDNKVVCHDCGNEWFFKFDKAREKELIKSVETFQNKIKDDETNLYKLTKVLTRIEFKNEIVNKIKTICASRGELKPIWVYIFTKYNLNTTNVQIILSELDKVKITVDNLYNYKILSDKLEMINLKISNLEIIDKSKADYVKESLVKAETELTNYTKDKNKIIAEIQEVERDITFLKRVKDLRDKLKSDLFKVNKSLDTNIAITKNKYVTELVSMLKNDMINIEHNINNTQQHKDKITNIQAKLAEYKSKEKVLKLMVKELSPTEGLIAKSINSFLNVFINEMNYIINSVWSYDMKLLPCEVTSEDDLDYKFQVYVDNNETISDVSLLSSSMKEIVDLAFKIVFLKYMDLTDSPLILDEFGRTMDPGHRVSAYNTIDNLLSNKFNQIFMVSHFTSMYGRFKNSDIIVLDPNNMDIEDMRYNEVIKINN